MRAALAGLIVAGVVLAVAACNEIVGNEEPTRWDPPGRDGRTDGGKGPTFDLCDGGTCGQDACDGPCIVDCGDAMVTDPDNNCGRCGRSCLGGKCVDGGCTPVLVSQEEYPVDVLVEPEPEGYVYWATGSEPARSRIMRRAKSLGKPPEIVADGGAPFFSPRMGMQGGRLYWLTDEQTTSAHRTKVNWANKDGTSSQRFEVEGSAGAVAHDGAAMYWTVYHPRAAVRRWPLGGDASTMATWWLDAKTSDAGARTFTALVAEPGPSERLFWLDSDGVHRIEKNGAEPKLVSSAGSPSPGLTLAVTKTELYFSTLTPQAIVRTNHDGQCPGKTTCPEVVVDSEFVGNARALTIEGNTLYWGNYPMGGLMRANLDGSRPTTLATPEIGGVVGIALDDRAIYYVTSFFRTYGSVWRVAK
ncbi:hypothetical protein [Pendulispora albinea]|uniref:Uncharacterized protein n=1 Tax=Pendulispora albinea TaxID=2741071 RepID=A0ABZ2LWM6_9BACT